MEPLRKVLHSKIHRATVTQADLDYEGSVTVPPDLLDAAAMVEYEAVSVWNVTNGARFETYVMRGAEQSRDICVNGAAAHHAAPGDLVIIACFTQLPESQLADHKPRLVFVDQNNRQVSISKEVPGPARRTQTDDLICTSI